MALRFEPSGVIPAVLLPMNDDLTIDMEGFRRHLRRVGATKGTSAVTVNGHSSEVAACSAKEQELVLETAVEELGDQVPVICGIYAAGSREAALLAASAERAGASALLVFPSETFINGVQARPQMAFAHYACIAEATDLPLVHFQYSLSTGQGLLLEDLLELVSRVPSIVAIKDWAGDPQLHERHVRELQGLPRPVNVLTTHSAWLLASLAVGPRGLLSGSGSVIADRQVALFNAVKDNDLGRATEAWDAIWPLATVFYSNPWADMHNRMKWLLHEFGEFDSPAVRPPLAPLSEDERSLVRVAAAAAGLEPNVLAS